MLEVVAGPAKGMRLEGAEPLELGRSASGAGALGGDPELSRSHARLERAGGAFVVEDLGSTNGTFVNGARIAAPTELRVGDELAVGGTRLRVTPAPAPAAPASAARRPALRVVAGFAPGALLHVDREVTLGRSGPAAKALGGDPAVAEEHVRVSPTGDGRLLLEDLGSPAGTIVGETPIAAPTLVSPGDRLRVGDSTLEVVTVAPGAPGAGDGVSGVLGGVRQVPEGLFARIGMRAPVTVADVVPVLLLSLGWAFAANLLIRTLAIEAFDVPDDLESLVLWQLLVATFCPVFFNSFGFYMTFRRPDDRSVVRYLIPTFGLPLLFVVLGVVRLGGEGGLAELIVTVAVVIVPVAISAPLMFRLRARVARERVGAVRAGRR